MTNQQRIELTVEVDTDEYGDIHLLCPECGLGSWVHPTPEEKRKYVFRIPHECPTGKHVFFTVRRTHRTDVLMRLLGAHDQEHGYMIGMTDAQRRQLHTRTVKNPKQ
jgi:hypothetical protein